MGTSRLDLALESGDAQLPEAGGIAVYRPPTDEALAALSKDRVTVFAGFRPDHDHFAARGYTCLRAPAGEYAAAIVFLPRAKALGRHMIADALARTGGGPVIVDGPKPHGVDSAIRALKKAGCDVSDAFAKAHGKLVTVSGCQLPDWLVGDAQIEGGFVTRAGSFSADGADPASALLAGYLPSNLVGRVADFGAGWGYLSRAVLAAPGVTECHLIEAEWEALEAARQNVSDPRAHFHWTDIRSFTPDEPFDHIITNPPFHESRAADPGLGQAFITAAARSLTPRGQVWLVANRHLPYESTLRQLFQQVTELPGTSSFKVYRAEKPKRQNR